MLHCGAISGWISRVKYRAPYGFKRKWDLAAEWTTISYLQYGEDKGDLSYRMFKRASERLHNNLLNWYYATALGDDSLALFLWGCILYRTRTALTLLVRLVSRHRFYAFLYFKFKPNQGSTVCTHIHVYLLLFRQPLFALSCTDNRWMLSWWNSLFVFLDTVGKPSEQN